MTTPRIQPLLLLRANMPSVLRRPVIVCRLQRITQRSLTICSASSRSIHQAPRLPQLYRYASPTRSTVPAVTWPCLNRRWLTSQQAAKRVTEEEEAEASGASAPSSTIRVVHGDSMNMQILLSDAAVQRLNAVLATEPEGAALRVGVDSGGCHGYQYLIEISQTVDENDIVFEQDGARLVVDDVSLPLLNGSIVDYTTELIGSTFRITRNPNASTTCGCDISFEIK